LPQIAARRIGSALLARARYLASLRFGGLGALTFGACGASATLAAKLAMSANDPAMIIAAASAAVSLVRKVETTESGKMEPPVGSIIAKPSTC
jgi:hypothetical protein